MFGWLKFNKTKPILHDTSEEIFLNNEGTAFYPLQCDPFIYAQSLDSIRQILLRWIKQDRVEVDGVSSRIEGTVSYLLYTFDLKLLPHDVYLSRLLEIIKDTDLNKSGSRLMDAVVLINTTIPIEVLECLKGKFLYSMLYAFPPNLTGEETKPTKEMWLAALEIVPWAPLILLIQELMMLEDMGEHFTPAPIVPPATAS